MSETKYKRDKKKQLGQFMTPHNLANKLIDRRVYKLTDRILEPSFGRGAFLFPIIDKLLRAYPETLSTTEKLDSIFLNNIFGVELDTELFNQALSEIQSRYSYKLKKHNLINSDFFLVEYEHKFNYVEGNPPFGGTFETKFGEKLDKIFGYRDKMKIKKETYSFFTVKCFELLEDDGQLGFICSDTFLSISTMKGLRHFLMKHEVDIHTISEFSEETNYGMVFFNIKKNNLSKIVIGGTQVPIESIVKTKNYSFLISKNNEKYFGGETLQKYITCSSGMTVGKNELFLKEITENYIIEKYNYTISEEPKTLEKEMFRSKLKNLSQQKKDDIDNGVLEKVLTVTNLGTPQIITLPNEDYCYYNKSSKEEIYCKPTTCIYWRNNGEAVKIFKKTGPWYLHGVGGEKFFCREGLTWRLISDEIRPRYLPSGYILDSGAPVAVLNEGVNNEELFFILGWLLTKTATNILKTTINHTKNIQSKDIERLPYPSWVNSRIKKEIIVFTKELVESKKNNQQTKENYKDILDNFFTK